jgi:hypothetical protein
MMELYILDDQLRRTIVFDEFESFIWTERWREFGDFELEVACTRYNCSIFETGVWVTKNDSWRVMEIESIEETMTDDGREILKIKGRGIEKILEDRPAALNSEQAATPNTPWVVTGTPVSVGNQMFNHICRSPGGFSLTDELPFLATSGFANIYPTIPNPVVADLDGPLEWEQGFESLYNALTKLCSAYDLGFRFTRRHDRSMLYFDVYPGNDRTSLQTQNTPIVFSVNLENISNTREYKTIENEKNLVLIPYRGSNGNYSVAFIRRQGVGYFSPSQSGWLKRITIGPYVSYFNQTGVARKNYKLGREILRQHFPVHLFDGNLKGANPYIYDVDYRLGDMVELRNKRNERFFMRVLEQVFVHDQTGEHTYPTLVTGSELITFEE